MKRTLLAAVLVGALATGLTACSKKQDAQAELKKAEEAMNAAPPPAPEPQPQPGTPAPVQAAPAPPPAQVMNQAMTSYKAGNYEDAVTRLQKLRSTQAMSAQQRMALQDAIASVMTELYARAEKGDARAAQAIKQYQATQYRR